MADSSSDEQEHAKASRRRDPSDDDSDDDSDDSDSEPEEDTRKKKKKKKKEKKKDKKKKKEKKKKKDKKKKKKKKKKAKKKNIDNPMGAINQLEYGARGIIRPDRAHRYEKNEEFLRWVIEVKDKQPSMMNKREEEDFFSMYCEDYNTCTLPDDKYYNLGAWEMREAKKRGLSTVQELYTDEKTMTDEEKAAMERRRIRDEQRQRTEDARTYMLMKQLKEAKRTDAAAFNRIEEEHRAKGPETFESIAKKRRLEKEARESAITKKLRGY